MSEIRNNDTDPVEPIEQDERVVDDATAMISEILNQVPPLEIQHVMERLRMMYAQTIPANDNQDLAKPKGKSGFYFNC